MVFVFVLLLLHVPARPKEALPLREKIQQLNVIGLLALFPGVVCLCLALQWGGTTDPVSAIVALAWIQGLTLMQWSAGRIIALLVLAFVLLIAFCVIQVWKPSQATVPPRIVMQRSVASGFLVASCLGAHMMLISKSPTFNSPPVKARSDSSKVYYLPVWFQAIKGDTPLESGIHLLPMVIPLVVASIVTGQLVSRIGYYTPFCIFGVCLTGIGAGLFTTFRTDTSVGKWVGYQIIYGFGLGACTQAPNMAAQTVLPREDVAIGASLMFFGQTLFGSVFTTVGQNVLDNQLADRLAGIPGLTPDLIQGTGVTDLFKHVPAEYRPAALGAYNDSLRVVFVVGTVLACLSIPASLAMEFRSVRSKAQPGGGNTDAVATAEKGERPPNGDAADKGEKEDPAASS